jgi:hypothetical protein
MDNREVRKRVLNKAVTAPETATPGALGGAALLVGAAMGNLPLLAAGAVALGVAAILGGVNLLFRTKRLREEVFQEMQTQVAREKERRLSRLYRRLRMDADSRSARSLRRLREMYESFHANSRWATEVDRYTAVDIANSVENLFSACVDALERSLELWETAQRIYSPAARGEVLAQREQLLAEVEQSIDQFAETVDEVHSLSAKSTSTEAVSSFRQELERNLHVARRVEERMRDLEAELQGPSRQREL